MGQYEPPKNVQDLAVMAQTLIPVVVEAVQQHLRVLAGDADAESEYTTEKLQEMATEAYRALAKSSTSKLLPLCLVEKEDKGEGGEEEDKEVEKGEKKEADKEEKEGEATQPDEHQEEQHQQDEEKEGEEGEEKESVANSSEKDEREEQTPREEQQEDDGGSEDDGADIVVGLERFILRTLDSVGGVWLAQSGMTAESFMRELGERQSDLDIMSMGNRALKDSFDGIFRPFSATPNTDA